MVPAVDIATGDSRLRRVDVADLSEGLDATATNVVLKPSSSRAVVNGRELSSEIAGSTGCGIAVIRRALRTITYAVQRMNTGLQLMRSVSRLSSSSC